MIQKVIRQYTLLLPQDYKTLIYLDFSKFYATLWTNLSILAHRILGLPFIQPLIMCVPHSYMSTRYTNRGQFIPQFSIVMTT